MSLFRQQAIDNQKTQMHGTIILVRPISFTFLTVCALLVGLVLVAFLIWGEYTKRSTVKGQLIPEQGLIYSHSPTSGIVIENHAHDGKVVKKGDLLYKISTAHHGDEGSTQKAIDEELALKNTLIQNQIFYTKQSQTQEINSILTAIERLKGDKQKLTTQIELQKTQVQLALDNLKRHQEISAIHAVSTLELNHQQMTYNT